MSVSATTPIPAAVSDPPYWASTVPDGHAPDPPVVNGNDQMSFGDFLSAINPLQHIPVVGTIYRAITGDTLNPAAQVVGGALLGGPIGLILAAFNAVVAEATGSDIGQKVIALVSPDKDEPTEIEKLATGPAVPGAEPPLPLEGWAPPAEAVVAPPARAELPPALQALAADLAKGATPVAEAAPATRPTALAAARSATPADAGNSRRDLAYYWRMAESRPVVASGPAAPAASTRVLPFSRPVSHPEPASPPSAAASAAAPAALAPAAAATPAAAAALEPAAEPSSSAESGAKPEGPPAAWFAAAMSRGLDRYEASKQKPQRGSSLDRAE